jgi:TetR/AcrR family transcriptional regulator, regulator of mycofactocin system
MASDSLRERKKAATHSELMTAALSLFDERGFDQTTVEEIAAAADVAPRTFFRYFPAKVDVLFADHMERVALLRETLATRSPDEPVVEAVRRASLAGVATVAADPSLFLTRSRLVASIPAAHAHGRHLDADFENVIAEAVLAGRKSDPATDLEARVVARTAWGAVCAARDAWLASDGELDPRDLLNEAFDFVQHGLRP